MTLEDLLGSKSVTYWDLPAGEDMSAFSGSACVVTLGSDHRARLWDPASDTNHLLGFCVNAPKQDSIAQIALPGLFVLAKCIGGWSVQDRLMPSSGADKGKVERWTATNVTCGFAITDVAAGEIGPILVTHWR